jgi:thioredoxin 1
MQLTRLSALILLLLGWMWLSPALALAQTTTAPNVLPQILEFDRKFCPVCRASERVILAVKNQYSGQFEVKKLYIDEADSLFRRYKVAIVPTQVFLNAAGQEVGRHEGVYKKEVLIQKLREMKFIRD